MIVKKRKLIMIRKYYSFLLAMSISMCSSCPTLAAPDHSNQATEKSFEEIAYNWTRTFAEALQITNQKHYKIPSLEECMIRSIDSFLNCLDPHSNFLDPKTYKLLLESTSGEFFGVGIIIDNTRTPKDDILLIIDTIPDGPSDKVGIKPLDKVIEIDGAPLKGMSTEEATAKLKGERGTKVTVKVMREGQPDLLTFEITRDVVKEQTSLSFYLKAYNVYYVSLNTFTQNAVNRIESLLKKAKEQKYKGLILDLRNNSGGLLNAAIDIAGLFLEKGSLVVNTKDKNHTNIEAYRTTAEPIAPHDLPIFILINNYTASAGEILAGCLKLHSQELSAHHNKKGHRKLMVFLVGTETFGKGSVQEVIPLSNNCAMKLTFALYFLPGDVSIQGKGITPDFHVERAFPPTEQVKWFKKHYGHEHALHNYIKNEQQAEPNAQEAPQSEARTQRWIERAQKMLEEDNQLREALTLLNILHMGQTCAPQQVSTREKALDFLHSIHVADKKLDLVPVE
jgi:carboxyl-terminal processing protease